jgi:hypothetical protein
MFKTLTILTMMVLLSGCANQKNATTFVSKNNNDIKELQLSVIKLYAKTNIDSGIILEKINKDLSTGKSIDSVLATYGTYFTDVKVDVNAVDGVDFKLVSTTTNAHVAKVTANELIPGYYNTGITGRFNIKQIEESRYIFNYSIKTSTLKKLDISPKNKIITTPDVITREFEQSLVLENNINMATAISNPEPKQYELYVIKILNKGE